MLYFFYFVYAFVQSVHVTRAVLRREKYMTEKDTIVLLVILFTAVAPIITAYIAYDAMKAVIVFLVTGENNR
jgi:hypothetical protein